MRTKCRGVRVGRGALGQVGDTPAATSAFTIVEILVVMVIILILAGLVLATSGYVHNKGARSRAEAEIAAMSAALENYKTDNGVYLSDPTKTDMLNAKIATPDFAAYQNSSATLYQALTGDTNGDGQPDNGARTYMMVKPSQIGGTGPATYVKDPFGNSYGYSTAGQAAVNAGTPQTIGYNPTFDLWSTAGSSVATGQPGWIKNW